MTLTRNVLWNLAGIALPLLVGVALLPVIIAELGVERFGYLAIIWLIIGYFSVFDFGFGRAVTKLVADRLASDRIGEIAPLTSTALVAVGASGVFGAALLALGGEWIVFEVLDASGALAAETHRAIFWLALSLPFVLVSASLYGLLEAYQRFAAITAVRVPLGVLTYAVPVLTVPFTRELDVITAGLAVVRIAGTLFLLALAFRSVPELRHGLFALHRRWLRPLATFGGWVTVSNVVGPVMVYFDRFLIAALLGSTAVAYYTVPYEVLTRLWAFPTALQGVLFPAFALLLGRNAERATPVFARASEVTLLVMVPALIAVVLLAHDGLRVWVGEPFAQQSTAVAQILMVGVLVNSAARLPFTFVQSAGHAKWTAQLHLIELPLYAAALWYLVRRMGLEGAAYAWTGRIVLDTGVLYAMTVRTERRLLRIAVRDLALIAAACIAAFALDRMLDDPTSRIAAAACAALACAVVLLNHAKKYLATDSPRGSEARP